MKAKNFVNYSAMIFALAGSLLIAGNRDWFPAFYNPLYMGIAAYASMMAILSLPIIFCTKESDPAKESAVTGLQVALTFILITNGLGALGLYKLYEYGFQYDKLVHFANAFVATAASVWFLHAWYGVSRKKALSWMILFIFFCGIGWEVFEFLSDTLFGTQTLGEYGQYVLQDTVWDVISNTLGILSATAFVLYKLARSRSYGRAIKIKVRQEI